jgi:hypothetical protein
LVSGIYLDLQMPKKTITKTYVTIPFNVVSSFHS